MINSVPLGRERACQKPKFEVARIQRLTFCHPTSKRHTVGVPASEKNETTMTVKPNSQGGDQCNISSLSTVSNEPNFGRSGEDLISPTKRPNSDASTCCSTDVSSRSLDSCFSNMSTTEQAMDNLHSLFSLFVGETSTAPIELFSAYEATFDRSLVAMSQVDATNSSSTPSPPSKWKCTDFAELYVEFLLCFERGCKAEVIKICARRYGIIECIVRMETSKNHNVTFRMRAVAENGKIVHIRRKETNFTGQ